MITNIESWWEWGRNLQHFSLKWLCTCMSLQHNGWELASLLITHYWLSSSISVRELQYGTFTASIPIFNHGVIRFLCRRTQLPFTLEVVWELGGSPTSILTPYLKSAGLFTHGVNFSSNSVQILQRYYDIQGQKQCRYGKPKFRDSFWPDDITMSPGERDSLNLGFPYLLCCLSVCCNIYAMAWQNMMKIS